jgi:D-arabinose 1-dehydrogenase-like Zn-dependent alcohol dehydrogenase
MRAARLHGYEQDFVIEEILAEQGRLHGRVERRSVENINRVFERLERGEIDGRTVLVP